MGGSHRRVHDRVSRHVAPAHLATVGGPLRHPYDSANQIRFLRAVATGPASALFAAEEFSSGNPRIVAIKVVLHRQPRDITLMRGLCEHANAARRTSRTLVCAEAILRVNRQLAFLSPWIDGLDLVDAVEVLREQDRWLPVRASMQVISEISQALTAAMPVGHHRDLKPTNVMIRRTGEVALTDFGTGYTSIVGRNARSGALQNGLLKYFSPARRDGKRDGAPGDVYALGILAVELLGGAWLRRLPARNPDHDRFFADLVARMPDLGLGTADGSTLCNLLLRATAFDESARPTMDEVAQLVERLGKKAAGAPLPQLVRDEWLPWIEEVPDTPLATHLEIRGIAPDEPDESIFVDPEIPQPIQVDSTEETTGRWILAAADLDETTYDTPSRPPSRQTPTRPVRVETPPLSAATKVPSRAPLRSLLIAAVLGALFGTSILGLVFWYLQS